MSKKTSPFHAEIGRTPANSIRITVRARNPKDQYERYRERAVCMYKLAAEMERRIAKLRKDWVVSTEVFNGRIDLELMEGESDEAAARFVEKVLENQGLR